MADERRITIVGADYRTIWKRTWWLGTSLAIFSKGAAKGVQIAQVKVLQYPENAHYASEGTHNTMKLSDLEKLTGGRYTILNIPLEDEKELIPFYDRLKKMKVAFAELPDLNLGDGYTQIAYNPGKCRKCENGN